jgi:hypothetical protein
MKIQAQARDLADMLGTILTVYGTNGELTVTMAQLEEFESINHMKELTATFDQDTGKIVVRLMDKGPVA